MVHVAVINRMENAVDIVLREVPKSVTAMPQHLWKDLGKIRRRKSYLLWCRLLSKYSPEQCVSLHRLFSYGNIYGCHAKMSAKSFESLLIAIMDFREDRL